MNQRFRSICVIGASVAALIACVAGLSAATRSSLFTLRVVEVADQPAGAPADAHVISELAGVKLGTLNLFDLDLTPIERRILAHPWIREVTLQKRFPQTLSITVVFREPKALLQDIKGRLSYIDAGGQVFGRADLRRNQDLPVVSGIGAGQEEVIRSALSILERWDRAKLSAISQVSSLAYDPEKGFRAWVTYPIAQSQGRALVELGHETDGELDEQLGRLSQVFNYLAGHGISVRQIFADSGKKIIVKIARRS